MNSELMIRADSAMIEKVVVGGDLSALAPTERLSYYSAVCESLGLNPLTKPFDYIRLNNKLTLYAKRDCTDQLRDKRKINITIQSREKIDDVYIVTAKATMPDGRTDESIGAVNINGLKGDALANALMKCETKAKRRVTLSIVGLGWLDETEIETIPDARPEIISIETGEVAPAPKANGNGKPKAESPRPYAPDQVREKIFTFIQKGNYRDKDTQEWLPIELHALGKKTPNILSAILERAFVGDLPESKEAMRHTILYWLFGVMSAKDLTAAQANALLVWLTGKETVDYNTPVNSFVPAEARAIYDLAIQEAEEDRLRAEAEAKANEVAADILGEPAPVKAELVVEELPF